MVNISRGPTFGDFVTICTEASMQDAKVTRLQTPLSLSLKCNVLRESLSVDSKNIHCATLKRRGSWVISVNFWGPLTVYRKKGADKLRGRIRQGLGSDLSHMFRSAAEHLLHTGGAFCERAWRVPGGVCGRPDRLLAATPPPPPNRQGTHTAHLHCCK